MADEIQDFIDAGLDRLYPGKWKRSIPLFSVVETDGIGILVIHDSEEGVLSFSAVVLFGLAFSPELVHDVGELNKDAVLGSFNLCEGQPGYWMVKYHIKLRHRWVEQTTGSAYMILDSLNAIPGFVNKGIEYLSPKHGGEPWETPEDPDNLFLWSMIIGD